MKASEFLNIFEDLDVNKDVKRVVATSKDGRPYLTIMFSYENDIHTTRVMADWSVEDLLNLGYKTLNPKTLHIAESGFFVAMPR